jgi:hypothetical protein
MRVELQLRGVNPLEEDGDLIWPIKEKRKQKLIHVGERKSNEPALITCEGSCSSGEVTWTVHHCVRGASYECRACGMVRRWGLDLW